LWVSVGGVADGDEGCDLVDETLVLGARKVLVAGAADNVSVETVDFELGTGIEIEFCGWKVVSVRCESGEYDVAEVFWGEGEPRGVRYAQYGEHFVVQRFHARSMVLEQAIAVAIADDGEKIGDPVDKIFT
jgi:hypothetical protein